MCSFPRCWDRATRTDLHRGKMRSTSDSRGSHRRRPPRRPPNAAGCRVGQGRAEVGHGQQGSGEQDEAEVDPPQQPAAGCGAAQGHGAAWGAWGVRVWAGCLPQAPCPTCCLRFIQAGN